MKNKYFIDGNGGLQGEQLANMKLNNYYLFRALSHLCKTAIDEKSTDKIGGPFRAALLSGELQRSDSQTGMDTNDLAGKLKFLVVALSDKSHPENIEKFKKSFLCQSVLKPLMRGDSIDDPANEWKNFKHTSNYDAKFKNKKAIDAAIICKRDDATAPLGIDFSKVIDSFVKTDKNGNYYLDDNYAIDDEIAMTDAVNKELKSLKNNKRFKDSYANPNQSSLEDENDIEDIID